jgi:hypothetical protein
MFAKIHYLNRKLIISSYLDFTELKLSQKEKREWLKSRLLLNDKSFIYKGWGNSPLRMNLLYSILSNNGCNNNHRFIKETDMNICRSDFRY